MLEIKTGSSNKELGLKELQNRLNRAAKLTEGADDEARKGLYKALSMMLAFIGRNIEVDTGRTRGSVFFRTFKDGEGFGGVIGSNVKYSPWVRDAGHDKHFLVHAAEQEGPRALAEMGRQYILDVKGAING